MGSSSPRVLSFGQRKMREEKKAAVGPEGRENR